MRTRRFIFIEYSEAVHVEVLKTDGEVYDTDDSVVLGDACGIDAQTAFLNLKKDNPYLEDYALGSVLAREVGKKEYYIDHESSHEAHKVEQGGADVPKWD